MDLKQGDLNARGPRFEGLFAALSLTTCVISLALTTARQRVSAAGAMDAGAFTARDVANSKLVANRWTPSAVYRTIGAMTKDGFLDSKKSAAGTKWFALSAAGQEAAYVLLPFEGTSDNVNGRGPSRITRRAWKVVDLDLRLVAFAATQLEWWTVADYVRHERDARMSVSAPSSIFRVAKQLASAGWLERAYIDIGDDARPTLNYRLAKHGRDALETIFPTVDFGRPLESKHHQSTYANPVP